MLNKMEFFNHLTGDLLPFWNKLYDNSFGGFYGSVDSDGNIEEKAPKSAVLQTRILWFYSSCHKLLGDEKLLGFADFQFDFIAKHMLDPTDGGICWSVWHDGKTKDGHKHTYALAFALYAFCAYYSAGKNSSALAAADRVFHLIENDFRDSYGYLEPYAIGSPGRGQTRTSNTLLHIIEAYTEYYKAVRTNAACDALAYAIDLAMTKAYNDDLRRIECYFDPFMNPVGDVLSYGHDIEASWLVHRACTALGDGETTRRFSPKLDRLAQNVISKGFVDEGRNGLYYDRTDGNDNKNRSWWVMAEAMVALVHRYRLYNDGKSMELAKNLWGYIKARFISPHGEWYAGLGDGGDVRRGSEGLCGAWKCPYHNGRMCLELIDML